MERDLFICSSRRFIRMECFIAKFRLDEEEGRKKEDEDARENDRLMEIESFVSCSLSVNFPSSDICNKRFIVINNRFLYC